MLIRDAELDFGARRADVRLRNGRVAEIGLGLTRQRGEESCNAAGCALLPSLCDHHIHLQATAAAQASVDCDPARCPDEAALARVLRAADAALPTGAWLRGVGFDEGALADCGHGADRCWLDAVLPERPARLQHRSGRMWLLNSAALRALHIDPRQPEAPLERVAGQATGRLFDGDAWLRSRMPSKRPDLGALSRRLWRLGVTALTDCSHDNDGDDWRAFAAAQAEGSLLQDLRVMGSAALDDAADMSPCSQSGPRLTRGERKFHLHDNALPDFDELVAAMRAAHATGRGVAVHCVSRVDLAFALSALREAGAIAGDRIEHASVAAPEAISEMAALGLTVVTQPGLIYERGDRYRREVEADDLPHLYRLHSLCEAGIALALSSDAPYSTPDPWAAMAAAVDRSSREGHVMGRDEALTPEAAYAAHAGPAAKPGSACMRLSPGIESDLLLLDRDWKAARADLAATRPQQVWRRGVCAIT